MCSSEFGPVCMWRGRNRNRRVQVWYAPCVTQNTQKQRLVTSRYAMLEVHWRDLKSAKRDANAQRPKRRENDLPNGRDGGWLAWLLWSSCAGGGREMAEK